MNIPTVPKHPLSGGEWVVAILRWLYYASPAVLVLTSPGHGPSILQLLTMLLPGLLALALLPLLTRRPRWVTGVIIVCWAISPPAFGPALVAQRRWAASGRRRLSVGVASLLVLAKSGHQLGLHLLSPGRLSPAVVEWTISIVGIVIATLLGWLAASHEAERQQAHLARRARAEAWEARVEQARLAERERIAREMHDVVAHRISLVALHAGALAHGMAACVGPGQQEPEELAMVRLIQGNAQASLDELRAMLGRLRGPDHPPEPPQPTLADLDTLVDDARQVGQHVDLVVDGDRSRVPQQVSRHAYRMVQEALTNARKHAPGAPVQTSVAISADGGVDLRVSNPLAPLGAPKASGAGLGLVGIAERVEQLDGTLWHGVRDGHFVLEAKLPTRGGAR